MDASKLSLIAAAMTANAAGDLTAKNTPALDDNSKLLATTEFFRQQFTGTGKQTLATLGHIMLPGGFILNWGQIAAPASTAIVVATYEKPFPTGFLCASVNGYVGNNTGVSGGAATWGISSLNALQQLRLTGSVAAACTFSFFAIGY